MISKSNIQDYRSDRILEKAQDYVYVLPHELLRPYISHYTITFPNKSIISEKYTVIPNGSSTFVFTFDGNKIGNRLFGAATKINIVGEEANRSILLLIISFQPCGLFHFMQTNQGELADLLLPLEAVDITVHKAISNIFEQASTIYELLSKLDKFFLSRINGMIFNSELALSVENIMSSKGILSIKELSDSVFYSERHLNRIFSQRIGMNMKTFSRLVRINKAIKLLKNPQTNITQAALQTGFYDQPHFIHEFKSICHVTPQEYLKNMSDFYNEISQP